MSPHTTKQSQGNTGQIGLVRLKTLIHCGYAPFSTSTLWRKVKDGSYPRPIKISEQITAWKLSDLQEWAADPLAYRSKKSGGSK
jgi:predicted DNA-binding transcriptional regulator AlpA